MQLNELKTDRDVFNFVKTHLLTQNVTSVDNNQPDICAYRGANNTKCAIGCLIADEFYHTGLEGQSYNKFIEVLVKKSIGFLPNPEMLASLQILHDNDSIYNWNIQLHKVEKLYFGKEH